MVGVERYSRYAAEYGSDMGKTGGCIHINTAISGTYEAPISYLWGSKVNPTR